MSGDSRRALVPGQVRVIVESTRSEDEVLITQVRVTEGTIPDDLDSPASLLGADVSDRIELHRGTRTGPDELVFYSFGDWEVPPTGGEFVVQWWWIDGTQQMLRDAREWRRETVKSHWFCPLTYRNLDEGDEAYTDGHGNWISVRGWEDFVRDDRLRLRSV